MPSDRAARLEARNAKKAEQEAQRLARTTPNMVNTPPPSPRSQAAAAAAAAATVGTGQAAGMGQAAGAGQAVGTGQAAGAGQVAGVGQAGNIAQQQGGGLTMVQITPPLRGGVVQFGTHQVSWTGGSPGVLQEPASHAAFRSQDSLKDAMKSEETCQEPLEEHSRLGMPDHKNDATVTLTEWITNVEMHMRDTGMDAVFFVRKNTNVATYLDLLEEWNQFSNDEINQWLEDETFDKYDRQNLRMSGTYLRNSIKIDLWRALEQTLQGRYEGPRIFVAIVRQHQVVGPLIVRELMADIQAMNIQQEPGENVANMATKIYRICKRITGMVRASKIPPDLPEICAQLFLNTKTTTFNVVMTNILLYARTETATWNEVLRHTTNEYNALAKGRNCEWLALHEHKDDPMIKAMQAQIKALQDKIKNIEGQLT